MARQGSIPAGATPQGRRNDDFGSLASDIGTNSSNNDESPGGAGVHKMGDSSIAEDPSGNVAEYTIVSDIAEAADEITQVLAGAQIAGVQGAITFDQLVAYVDATRAYQGRAYADTAQVDNERRQQDLAAEERRNQLEAEHRQALAQELSIEREEKRKVLEARLRGLLAAALVIGILLGILLGITKGIAAQELSLYLAPITGLAGTVVGYFFGRETK